MKDNQIQDYITFGRTFENYKWYKPLFVAIVGIIAYVVIVSIISVIFMGVFGDQFGAKLTMGYEGINNFDAANIFGFLTLIAFIPSLYIASRIIKDRPFSSYSSSRGGWDWKIYLKSFLISAAVIFILMMLVGVIDGFEHGTNQLTAIAFITFLIIIPLQSIAEEYLFRGFIMQTIGSWTNMPIVALIVPTLIFAALHPYNIFGMASI
ncbi:CPBP family intramembrane glutamic endopeptidase [Methanobrevibacter sp.]|uniref:CPBP family intramembrane glutamic endopeptidase n=1 Tax=Methanobrevibacter sp. TaxID=66852 RepID=UPI00388EC42D